MNKKNIFFPICFAFIFLTACSSSNNNKNNLQNKIENVHVEKNNVKYPISLDIFEGQKMQVNKIEKGFSFSHVKDKAVLMVFMTTSCPPCKAQIPNLNNLQKKYKKDLKVIGVLLEDKDIKKIKQFIKTYNINFALSIGENNQEMARAIGDVRVVPFTILYNKKGQYSTHYTGAVPEEMMNIDIQKVVK